VKAGLTGPSKTRWMEVWCEEHKRCYYWDKKTGKTSWYIEKQKNIIQNTTICIGFDGFVVMFFRFAPTADDPSPGVSPEALTPEKKGNAKRT